MGEVITAVYEISAEDPAGRAVQVAVEQSHELPTELAPGNAVRDSLGHVRSVLQRPGRPALATVDYPAGLAGAELGQLLVLLLGNVSLQDGVRLADVTLPAGLAAALPGPRLGIAGVRALAGEPGRALLATALKPVGMNPAAARRPRLRHRRRRTAHHQRGPGPARHAARLAASQDG